MSKSSIKCEGRGDAEQSRSLGMDHNISRPRMSVNFRGSSRGDLLFASAIQIGSIWFTGIAMHETYLNKSKQKNRTEAKLLLSLAQYSAMMAWRSRNPATTTRWHGENERSNRNDDRNGNNKKIQKERKKTNNYLRSLRISKKKTIWRNLEDMP